MKHLTQEEIRESGLLQEANRTLCHPMGLALEARPDGTIVVQDHRNDEQGVVFAAGVLSLAKHRRFWNEWNRRRPERRNALGFMTQPPPEPSEALVKAELAVAEAVESLGHDVVRNALEGRLSGER